jgi:HlyD family secretion protein
VAQQNKPVPASQPAALPAEAPFRSYVAGSAIVEANTENIGIGTHVPGVVTELYVRPGSTVKAGDPLFKLDDRQLRAELAARKTTLQVTRAQLERLVSQPRAEDVPPAEARVEEAKTALADLQHQLELWDSVADKRAVSQDELFRRRFAVLAAQHRLREAEAQLTLLKAGAWKPDIDIAKAQVAAAEAQAKATETDIERLTVRAPVAGEIMQVKIRLGEFAMAGVLQTPLILLGNTQPLHVRVDIDENDAWRVGPDAAAVAFVRGNREIKTPLKFVRTEPYVVPKRSLTGDSTERVDTRVLQILYSFDRQSLPIYVGQQMDVFIEAPPVGPNAVMMRPISGGDGAGETGRP